MRTGGKQGLVLRPAARLPLHQGCAPAEAVKGKRVHRFTTCQPYEPRLLISYGLKTDVALALPLPRRWRWSRRLRRCRVRWRLWRNTCHPRQRLLHGRLLRRQGTRRIRLPLQQTSFSHQLRRQSGLRMTRRSLRMRRRYLYRHNWITHCLPYCVVASECNACALLQALRLRLEDVHRRQELFERALVRVLSASSSAAKSPGVWQGTLTYCTGAGARAGGLCG